MQLTLGELGCFGIKSLIVRHSATRSGVSAGLLRREAL